MSPASPRRYAVVGTGHRSEMYIRALLTSHADVGSLVAWCDTNPVRMHYYDELAAELAPGTALPASYSADQFEQMLDEAKPDALIVTTPDYLHSKYICAGLARGLRVISEKPLTTDGEKARAIADAASTSDGDVTVTFNYRYSPRNTLVKELINSGEIGQVTSVHFEWLLDTGHGADYFRRWHREKDKSGGLLIHKASHHFDLVNWWLADAPRTVTALGALRFYGAENARARGDHHPGVTSRDLAADDPYRIDLAGNDRLRRLYLNAEHVDGYQRDRNVFGEPITIEDTMNVLVGYERGTQLTYSLYAYAPWEGYRVAFNGTRGRIELDVVESPHRAGKDEEIDPSARHEEANNDKDSKPSEARTRGSRLLLQRHWERAREIPIPEGRGGHGGGDARLLDDIFRADGDDPLGHRAGWRAGLRSVAIGICANESMITGQSVPVASLGLPILDPAATRVSA
ncbi:Gfo/Idh/MocA family oxidoreductase [Microlunatus elymi]|uniref:Gfo/Idh/MocA family oxidoreductase n=1 Tax=Microlunatus elymi TaxID=2596828 RepID=A0A516Q200_9ACTN|nr:Gfo/Idh/MocA family oxidoreductase [Microlunatus elymi]QDP97428.1 Gfo/Idh/MocA family oxidoreductase [Microlunatus elymi]